MADPLQTNSAVLQPKQVYLTMLMNSISRFGEICASPVDPSTNKIRVAMLTRIVIAMVPNEEKSEMLFNYREEKLREYKKKDTDTERLQEYTFTLDCKILAKVVSLMDDVLALTDRQVILEAGVINSLDEKYFPSGIHISEDREEL